MPTCPRAMPRLLALMTAATLATVFTAGPVARAQAPSPAAQAGSLAARAAKDARARRYEQAVEGYRQAFERRADPAYLYNIAALYLLRMKRPLEAWDYGQRYRDAVRTDAERRDADRLLEKAEAALAATHGRMRVEAEPAGTLVSVDVPGAAGRLVRPVAWLAAGSHEVFAEAPGHEPSRVAVAIERGGETAVRLSLRPIVPAPAPAPPPEPAPAVTPAPATTVAAAAQQTRMHPGRIAAWTTLATGAALAVTGSVLYGLAYRDNQDAGDLGPDDFGGSKTDYDAAYDQLLESRDGKARAAYALWGTGAAALGVGLALYFALPERSPVTVVPTGAGLAVAGRW